MPRTYADMTTVERTGRSPEASERTAVAARAMRVMDPATLRPRDLAMYHADIATRSGNMVAAHWNRQDYHAAVLYAARERHHRDEALRLCASDEVRADFYR